jgi:hypothetical protein
MNARLAKGVPRVTHRGENTAAQLAWPRGNASMNAVLLARLQFAFTISVHIIFPAFTIGLSAFIATLLILWQRTGREHFHRLARFWTKIFAVSFAMGVVSGIPMSYEFGANWSRFSEVAGNVSWTPDRLRSSHGVLSRSDLPGRAALRLDTHAAVAAGNRRGADRRRHGDVGFLDPLRQQLDADSGRPPHARRHRLSGRLVRHHLQSELSRTAWRTCSPRRTSRPRSWCWRSVRATSLRAHSRRRRAP